MRTNIARKRQKVLIHGFPVLLYQSGRLKTLVKLVVIDYQVAVCCSTRFCWNPKFLRKIQKTISWRLFSITQSKNPYDGDKQIIIGGECFAIKFNPTGWRNNWSCDYELRELSVDFNNARYYEQNKAREIAIRWAIQKVATPIIKNRFTEIRERCYPQLRKHKITLTVKYLQTKWGICRVEADKNKFKILINTMLIHYQKRHLEYIIHHELNHVIEQNHRTKFWIGVQNYVKNCFEIKKELDDWKFWEAKYTERM